MSAIFPPPAQGGVPLSTPGLCNAYSPNSTVVGGGPYYIAPDCSTLLTDCQVNGITSEILAAVDLMGCQYEFTRIDNLGRCLNFRFQALQDLIDGININLGVFVQSNPPPNAEVGWLWWRTTDGQLFVYYDDGTSKQWVIANRPEGGGGGASVFVRATPPLNPQVGWLWWDTTVGHLFIWYNDGDSSQWVSANTIGGGPGFDWSEIATRTWVLSQIALGGTFIDAPADGVIYARQDNQWVEIAAGDVDGGTW